MARTKSTRSASSKSSSSSQTKSASKSRRAPARSAAQRSDSADESSFSSAGRVARDFVDANANLQSAGIALAGAGILALVSTQAGRNLIKSATDAVVNIVSQRYQQFAGDQQEESDSNTSQRPSRQRDQARI